MCAAPNIMFVSIIFRLLPVFFFYFLLIGTKYIMLGSSYVYFYPKSIVFQKCLFLSPHVKDLLLVILNAFVFPSYVLFRCQFPFILNFLSSAFFRWGGGVSAHVILGKIIIRKRKNSKCEGKSKKEQEYREN
jgi:hypothetical protein